MANNLVKGSGCGTREWREDFVLTDSSGNAVFTVTHNTGTLTLGSAANLIRTAQKRLHSPLSGKVGATAGWVITAGTNKASATLPASQTGSTLVVPINGLKVGDTITSFHLAGQIESAGGAVTVDADLRKLTVAAADLTDASVGSMTQLAVSADTAMSSANTEKASLAEVVGADEMFYVLITATTAASTDIDLQAIAVTVTEA